MSHESHKYGKELKEVDRNVSLSDSIAQEKGQISFYWNSFVITSVAGGAAAVGFILIAYLRLVDWNIARKVNDFNSFSEMDAKDNKDVDQCLQVLRIN